MKITLSDGTQVWLNENSRLTYPTVFRGKDRCVTLQGEAYFQVTHDDHHPFIVKAGGMETRVLGTEFNVNTSDASHPHVTLVEGSVEVSAIANNMVKEQKVISPGEDATVDAHGDIKVEHVDTNDMVCWKDGIQLFDNASLREILIQLGSWYNADAMSSSALLTAPSVGNLFEAESTTLSFCIALPLMLSPVTIKVVTS